MEGHMSTGGGDNHRTEFNSAYANLEQTIRNFSKEKTCYEQTIEDLRIQVQLAHENLKSLVARNENIIAENKALLAIQEEHDNHSLKLETILCSLETKHAIVFSATEGLHQFFPTLEQEAFENQDFVTKCKFRQVQLKDWIDETLKKNDEISKEYRLSQEQCEKMRQTLNEALIKIQFQAKELEETKSVFKQEMEKQDMDRRSALEHFEIEKNKLTGQITELEEKIKSAQDTYEEERASLEEILNSERMKIEELTSVLNTERSTWDAKEKEMLVNIQKMSQDFSQEREALAAKMDSLTISKEQECAKLLEEIKSLNGRNDSLKDALESMIANSTAEIASLKLLNEQYQNRIAASDEDFVRYKENIATLEIQIKDFTESAKKLEANHAAEKASFEDELKKSKAETIELKDRLDAEVDSLKTQLHEEQKNLLETKQHFDAERTKLFGQLEEARSSLEKTEKNHHDVKTELEEKLSTLSIENNNRGTEILSLEAKIKELEGNMEVSKRDALANHESFEKSMQEAKNLHVSESATLQTKIDDLETKIDEANNALKDLELAKVNVEAELNAKISEMSARGESLESEKTKLVTQLEELKTSSEVLAAKLRQELEDIRSTYEEEMEKLKQEKQTLADASDSKIRRMTKELDAVRIEKNTLQKKYESQKSAIAKMVEQVDVRPVALPKAKPRDSSINGTPQASQDQMPSEAGLKTPKTPFIRPVSRPDPLTPTRTSILKRRNTFHGNEKSRSVTFGPVDVQDFVVSSGTETEDSVENDPNMSKEGNRKKIKLAEKRKVDSDEETSDPQTKFRMEKEDTRPARRYIKRGFQQYGKKPNYSDGNKDLSEDSV